MKLIEADIKNYYNVIKQKFNNNNGILTFKSPFSKIDTKKQKEEYIQVIKYMINLDKKRGVIDQNDEINGINALHRFAGKHDLKFQ